jgi:hypothetical protein
MGSMAVVWCCSRRALLEKLPTPSREVFDVQGVQGAWDTAAAPFVATGIANLRAVSEGLPRAFFAAGAGR